MKSMFHYLAAIFIVLATVAGCGKIADKIKNHVEVVGSELTGTRVKIDEFNLQLARGMGEIKGVSIANPPGYQAPLAVEMGLLHLNLGIISTIAGEPLVLDELVISYPVVNYEQSSAGGSNLEEIAENTKKNEQKADEVSAEQEAASDKEPGEPFRLIVHHLIIEGVTLNVLKNDGSHHSATLPRIELTEVGGEEGVKPGRFGMIVVGAMTRELVKQSIARELIEREDDIRNALSAERLTELIGERFELSEQQLEAVRPAVGELSNALMATVNLWIQQGFVDYKTLASQLAPAKEKLQDKLEEILAGEQVEQVRKLFNTLKANSTEIIRNVVTGVIADKLGLTVEQLREVRPVLRDHMVQLSDLIETYTSGQPEKTLADFAPDYNKLISQLRQRVEGRLSEDQVQKLMEIYETLLPKINALLAVDIQEK